MILITHGIVGAALSQGQQSLAGAFIVSVISHYLLDTVPHYEYSVEKMALNPKSREALGDFLKTVIDGLLGVILPLLIFYPQNFSNLLILAAGIFGGLLPDALQGVYLLFPNRFFSALQRFHVSIHAKIRLDNYPVLGIVSQAGLAVLFIWFGFFMGGRV